ncbi:MAG: hypothetical protein JNJ56_10275 [Ignavibacteria bacterium]|nr:hypothetical protein [Ignavibacteria bacterium]
MKKLFLLCVILFLSGTLKAQSDWKSISYFKTNGLNELSEKKYCIVTVSRTGTGNVEIFDSSKAENYKFSMTVKEMKKFNKKIKKSGIYKINQDSLKSGLSGSENVKGPYSNMTITLEYTKEQIEEMKRENEEKEKNPVLLIPADYNRKYIYSVSRLFDAVENIVPDDIRNKTELLKK